MSAAAAPATAEAPPKKGKKKLIIILAAVLLLAGIGGGVAVYMMKKKAAEAAAAEAASEEGEGAGDAHAKHAPKKEKKGDAHAPPVFVPLEPFTVNLADKRGRALRAGGHHAGRSTDATVEAARSRPTCPPSATTS